MTRAIAGDCRPYHVPNVHCDAYCVYTNHTYATSFRSFGVSYTFAIERAMDKLAFALGMDSLEVRLPMLSAQVTIPLLLCG